MIQSYRGLLGSHFFAIEGLPTVIAVHEGDREGHPILRCAAIVAFIAIAVLLRTLSQALTAGQGNPTFPSEDQAPPVMYRKRCRKSLKEAIKITRGLTDADFPFIDIVMSVSVALRYLGTQFLTLTVRVIFDSRVKVYWFQIYMMTAELGNEDVTMGISPERESPPPSIPPASKSPTITSAQPVTRADRILQQQAQYQREHQQRQRQRSPQTSQPPSSSASPSVDRLGWDWQSHDSASLLPPPPPRHAMVSG